MLFHIAEASVEQPDGRVRDVVFLVAGGEQKLRDLVAIGPGGSCPECGAVILLADLLEPEAHPDQPGRRQW